MDMDNVVVSIACTAYNHEKYIRKCIEGFLSQKTNFKYEVIIHDDASTDDTTKIIMEYAKKYPDIIKPIYQKENQMSQNIKVIATHIVPKMIGKYYTVCEGDDYWSDPYKLQKQVDYMEKNPECSLCLHKVQFIKENGDLTKGSYPVKEYDTVLWSSSQFLKELITESLFHISSVMVRMNMLREYYKNKPEFTKISDVGDRPFLLYFGQLGQVFYFNEVMSHYRKFAIGSWTSRNTKNVQKSLLHYQIRKKVMEKYDEYTEYKYHDLCDYDMQFMAFMIDLTKNDVKSLKENGAIYKKFRKNYSMKNKFIYFCRINMPDVFVAIKKLMKDKTR